MIAVSPELASAGRKTGERLSRYATEDLLTLERELRRLQKPNERKFWRPEQMIGRISDELERRTA
jgi:hypothetical protein